MSFKQYIPDTQKEWNEYWEKTTIEDELKLVETDGLLPLFKKFLPKQGKILEAGCGLGKWVITLARKGYSIEGVDNNNYVIKKIKKNFPNIKIQKADVRKLPYNDQTFAAYLSLGVVEHFEKGPEKALKEACRVLKKGGIAFIEVPFDSVLRKITRLYSKLLSLLKTPARLLVESTGLRKKRQKIKTKFYEYRYTRKELKNFLLNTGFSDIKIFAKDNLSEQRSFALWLDYPKLQAKGDKMFQLNKIGIFAKKILNSISPFTYCALIVAVAKKP